MTISAPIPPRISPASRFHGISRGLTIVRRAIASYYALVSFLDYNIGQVVRAIDRAGLTSSTRVIYTSDHGDNLGARGAVGQSDDV